MNKLSILIIDDAPEKRQFEQLVNNIKGCEILSVDVVNSGNAALTKVKQKNFDLMFFDVLSGHVDGIDCVKLFNEFNDSEIYVPFYIASNACSESLQLISDLAERLQLPMFGNISQLATVDMLKPLLKKVAAGKINDASPAIIHIDELDNNNEIIKALEHDEIQLLSTPVKQLKSDKINYFTVLFLWPEKATQFNFSDIKHGSNKTNLDLYSTLIEKVITNTCLAENKQKVSKVSLKVNVEQLNDPSFFVSISQCLNKYAVPKSCVVFEIDEDQLQQDFNQILSSITRCRINGFEVSISAIKKGYQSLLLIRELPISQIKLDVSIVNKCNKTVCNKVLIGTLIKMAKMESISCVAVGVKNKQELETLKNLSCDHYQPAKTIDDNFLTLSA